MFENKNQISCATIAISRGLIELFHIDIFILYFGNMKNNKLKGLGILFFSPTNTTKKICNAIAMGMGAKKYEQKRKLLGQCCCR